MLKVHSLMTPNNPTESLSQIGIKTASIQSQSKIVFLNSFFSDIWCLDEARVKKQLKISFCCWRGFFKFSDKERKETPWVRLKTRKYKTLSCYMLPATNSLLISKLNHRRWTLWNRVPTFVNGNKRSLCNVFLFLLFV